VCSIRSAYRPSSFTHVAQAAAESYGVLSLDELRACGLKDGAIKRRVAAGLLHPLHLGVYAVGHLALTPEARWLAAVKACGPGALLSHTAALMLYGLLPSDDRRPEVTLPPGTNRKPPGVNVHRTRRLPLEDTWRHKGIPVTTVERALMDVAATWTDDALRRAMATAQSRYLTNLRRLAAVLDRTGPRPGRARYVRVLASGPQPTRSELEIRVLDLVLAGGFQPPDVNTPLLIEGRRIVPDLRWPEQRLIVEADGGRWHDNPQARALDAERQALLEAHGERLLRVDWHQATVGTQQTLTRIARAGAPTARP
jgi:hypothetical protein